MKDSTLFFRSLAIIILIAGIAHLVRLGGSYTRAGPTADSAKDFNETIDSLAEKRTNENPIAIPFDDDTDYIVGKWIVQYKSEEFNGLVLYDLKNAFTYTWWKWHCCFFVLVEKMGGNSGFRVTTIHG